MVTDIEGVPFEHVCQVVPGSVDGKVIEYRPQGRYRNENNLPLHKYGKGPFCRFSVPKRYARKTGVYLILIDGQPKYVGECEDLARRYNTGYGNISPRNCYKGGQPTNCRINNHILREHKKGSKIDLCFHETQDRFAMERSLYSKLRPEWNLTSGKVMRTG